MAAPNPKALKIAINKRGGQRVYFALEGDGFDPANGRLELGRTGEAHDWDCKVLKNDSLTTKLVGSFKYRSMTNGDAKEDSRGTEELEFIITNPGSPPVSFKVTVTVVDDTP